jgi:hypothetical protein
VNTWLPAALAWASASGAPACRLPSAWRAVAVPMAYVAGRSNSACTTGACWPPSSPSRGWPPSEASPSSQSARVPPGSEVRAKNS